MDNFKDGADKDQGAPGSNSLSSTSWRNFESSRDRSFRRGTGKGHIKRQPLRVKCKGATVELKNSFYINYSQSKQYNKTI